MCGATPVLLLPAVMPGRTTVRTSSSRPPIGTPIRVASSKVMIWIDDDQFCHSALAKARSGRSPAIPTAGSTMESMKTSVAGSGFGS